MDLNLVEDDEHEKARKWWLENRVALISGVVLGLSIIVGVNLWGDYQADRGAAASVLYQELIEFDVPDNRISSRAVTAGNKIIEDYSDTAYAGKAALILARIAFEGKDVQTAKEKLNWAIKNAPQFETVHTARLRLASLLMIDGKLEESLSALSVEHMEGFETHYYEMRGDIYLQLKQADKARDAYRAAIDGLSAGSMYEPVLRMKLDSISSSPIS